MYKHPILNTEQKVIKHTLKVAVMELNSFVMLEAYNHVSEVIATSWINGVTFIFILKNSWTWAVMPQPYFQFEQPVV